MAEAPRGRPAYARAMAALDEVTTGDRLHALMAAMAEGVVVHAADGTITDRNPAAERMLGLSRDQLAGRTSIDPRWAAIHEDGAPFPGETHPAMVTLRTGVAQRGVVMGVRIPDGSDRWIAVSTEPIRPASRPDSPPSGVVATFTELTALRREQAARAESELRYRWLAEHVHDVIWTLDPATLRFTYVSPSITGLRGITVEAALAESLAQALTPDSLPRLVAHLEGLLEAPPDTEPFVTDVFEQPCAAGSPCLVEITLSAIRSEDGRVATILGVSRNVSARVAAERAREETVAELREALAKVRTLSGLLPICMYCKRIRTDEGYWDRIESYLSQHTDAHLSHGLCPDCYRAHVPADLQGDEVDGPPVGPPVTP